MTPFSDANSLLCPLLIVVLPLAPAGLAFLNTGLGRSRSAAQALLGALCIVAVSALAWFFLGNSLAGFPGLPAHGVTIGGTWWDWIATRPPFFHRVPWNGGPECCATVFEMFAVSIAALIPWGSGAERWRLSAACLSTAVLCGLIDPLFAHWVWGGGWLARLGSAFQLGSGFGDPGGAATIQIVGALNALVVVWILGPRRGKFPANSPPAALPAHHIVYALFGSVLTFIGWLALNALAAILFAGAGPGRVVLVEVNTLLCASGALLAALIVTRIRFTKPDASLCANGWVGGLVASSAVAALVSPAAALFTGIIAGGMLPLAIEFLELRCSVDDPSGGITVHGLCGLWGLIAAGVFAPAPSGQLMAQLVGVATLLGFMLPVVYGAAQVLNRVIPFRTHPEGERVGMDLHELGAGAYPEFVLHSDEFLPR